MKFQSGTKTTTRIQLPLIPEFALTVHKSQGLNKAYVLFVASSRLFARALSYVALSRCTTLEGLYIADKKINTEHFKQTL
jgi:ATP-dependent exoDNAse (exonuclease V) alpha subunit